MNVNFPNAELSWGQQAKEHLMSQKMSRLCGAHAQLRSAAAVTLTLGLLLACATPAPSPGLDQARASLDTAALSGTWAGEGAPTNHVPRRWVMLRKPDGRFEMQLTTFSGPRKTEQSTVQGSWSFRDGLLQVANDGNAGPPYTYRVEPEASGCLMLQQVDAKTGKPGAQQYSFVECPHPSPVPAEPGFQCRASFSDDQQNIIEAVDVRINLGADGHRKAMWNGEAINENVDVWDYPIRLNFDPANEQIGPINAGETALKHLHALTTDAEMGLKIDVPFHYRDVRMVRIYELVPGSRFDKFGGSVLFEVFDAQGQSLAKMVRALLVTRCVPVARVAQQ